MKSWIRSPRPEGGGEGSTTHVRRDGEAFDAEGARPGGPKPLRANASPDCLRSAVEGGVGQSTDARHEPRTRTVESIPCHQPAGTVRLVRESFLDP